MWKIPLGEYPDLAAKGLKNTGTENYGGPLVTAGGLVFIAATNFDKKFRAFDKSTGALLWETTLPFAGNTTPITYELNGRQFVVIAAGGGKDPKSKSGGSLRGVRAEEYEVVRECCLRYASLVRESAGVRAFRYFVGYRRSC